MHLSFIHIRSFTDDISHPIEVSSLGGSNRNQVNSVPEGEIRRGSFQMKGDLPLSVLQKTSSVIDAQTLEAELNRQGKNVHSSPNERQITFQNNSNRTEQFAGNVLTNQTTTENIVNNQPRTKITPVNVNSDLISLQEQVHQVPTSDKSVHIPRFENIVNADDPAGFKSDDLEFRNVEGVLQKIIDTKVNCQSSAMLVTFT